MTELLGQFFIAAFMILTAMTVGSLVKINQIRSKEDGPLFKLFIDFLFGALLIATLTAVWHTQGVTIFIVFVPLLLFIRVPERLMSFNRTTLLFLASGLLCIFLLDASKIIILSEQLSLPYNFSWRDNIFYANVCNSLSTQGVESGNISWTLLGKSNSPVAYHYFELWLNLFTTKVFGGVYIINFHTVTGIFLKFGIFLGFGAVLERYFKSIGWQTFIWCLFALYFCGGFFEIYKQIFFLKYIEQYSQNTFLIKYAPFYLSGLLFVNIAIRGAYKLGLTLLSILYIFNITALPGVLGGVLLLFLYAIVRKEQRTVFPILTVHFGVIVYIFAFYLIFGDRSSGSSAQNLNKLDLDISVDYLKTMINVFIGTGLQIAIVYIPAILTIVLFARKQLLQMDKFAIEKKILLYLILVIFSGTVSAALIFRNIESFQLANSIVTLLNIGLICALAAIAETMSKKQKYTLLLVFVTLTGMGIKEYQIKPFFYAKANANFPYYEYSDEYLGKIDQALKNELAERPIGASNMGNTDLSYKWAYNPNYFNLGIYLPYMSNRHYAVSINDYDAKLPQEELSRQRAKTLLNGGIFSNFCQYKTPQPELLDSLKWAFIKQNNMTFVIQSPNAERNPYIEANAKRKIKDENTGEEFILLSY